MRYYKILIYLFIGVLLASCDDGKKEESTYNLEISSADNKIRTGGVLKVKVDTEGKQVDSIRYFYADQYLKTDLKNKETEIELTFPLGRHEVLAEVYADGKKEIGRKEIVLHADKKPVVYTYKITNAYPHNIQAFTQGLEFYQDTLYESTGHYGLSSLRKVDYKSGEILKEIKLEREYFGEGLTVMNDKIYQLTWREGVGFVYDVHSFEKLKTFNYDQSPEGWGLCNDGEVIYKSDGTDKIWLLDPETLEEMSYIEPVTNNSLANQVNELEFINGKIYANTWQKEGVLIIDPKTGAVEGLIDFRGLKDKLDQPEKAEVFNGIAYHKETDKIYVTGKNWDKLFEVEIVEK